MFFIGSRRHAESFVDEQLFGVCLFSCFFCGVVVLFLVRMVGRLVAGKVFGVCNRWFGVIRRVCSVPVCVSKVPLWSSGCLACSKPRYRHMTTKRTVLWESCGVRPLTGCCVVVRVDLGPCVRVRVENPCGLSTSCIVCCHTVGFGGIRVASKKGAGESYSWRGVAEFGYNRIMKMYIFVLITYFPRLFVSR